MTQKTECYQVLLDFIYHFIHKFYVVLLKFTNLAGPIIDMYMYSVI